MSRQYLGRAGCSAPARVSIFPRGASSIAERPHSFGIAMNLRARIAALLFGVSLALPHADRKPSVATEVRRPVLTPGRRAELREAGRAAVETLCARSQVERAGLSATRIG